MRKRERRMRENKKKKGGRKKREEGGKKGQETIHIMLDFEPSLTPIVMYLL